MQKSCNKCGIVKPLESYSKRKENVYHGICKSCLNEYAKEYRNNNKSIIKEKQSNWYENKGKEWKKKYELDNRDIINEKSREKYKNDNQYRMKKILRTRFKTTILGKKTYKKSLEYLDVDLEYFLKWIEYNFDNKMSWENQGVYWDIDHVIPCSSFDFTNEEDVKKCFNWKNMRPCEKKENYKKNDKIIDSIIKEHNNKINLFISKYPVPS